MCSVLVRYFGSNGVMGRGKTAIIPRAPSLLELRNRIDTGRLGEPSFLMALAAGSAACHRDDGVLVVPLVRLKL